MAVQLAPTCMVCGTILDGPAGTLFQLLGIRRSLRNPNLCNRCDAHMQEGHIVEMTVLFADLTGFTEMTNRLGPNRTFEVLDAFFKMANEVLITYDAFIDKYIGDSVMALFNAPIPNANHAAKAVQAALGIQEGLATLAAQLGLDLQARVGVAKGYARVGRLGSADRKDFTAIGDVVNLASRLQAVAQPGEVIVDGNAFAQVADAYPVLAPESVAVRGFDAPVEAYRIGSGTQPPLAQEYGTRDALAVQQRMGLGTLLVTLLGAPCAVTTLLGPLAVLVGLGSVMGALSPLLMDLDSPLIRVPLQLIAALGALANLYVIRRGYAQQQASPTLGLTTHEKRKVGLVVMLSIVSLLALGYELYVHVGVMGMPYL